MKKLVVLLFAFLLSSFGGDASAFCFKRCCTIDCTGEGGGGTYYTPPVYVPSPAEIANNRAVAISHQALAALNRGDHREAIRLYQAALRAGPNRANAAILRRGLGVSYNNLGAALSHKGNWEEALRWYLEAQRYYSDPVLIDNIAKVRASIENDARQAEEQRAAEIAAAEQQRAAEIAAQEAARKEAQRQTDLAAAQQRTSELLANLRDNLPGRTLDGNSPSTEAGLDFMGANEALAKAESGAGLDFMDGTGAPAKSTSVQEPSDTSVVDARSPIGSLPPGLPRLEEVENSPGREAWLRGMDAVIKRDWELAAAWFGTAQLRDPTNAALGRAVALAQWTRDNCNSSGQCTANSSAKGTVELAPALEQADMNAMVKEMVDSLSPEEQTRLRNELQQTKNAAKAAQRGAPVVMSDDDVLAMVFPHSVTEARKRPGLNLRAKANEARELLNALSPDERARFTIDAAEKEARKILKSLSPEERKRLGLGAQEASDSEPLLVSPGGGKEPDARTHARTGLAPGAVVPVERQ